MDYHSPGADQPWQLKQHLPSDEEWLTPQSPLQSTEQIADYPGQKTLQNRNENQTGKWFHVTKQQLQPGTKLTPGGGSGLHSTNPAQWQGDPRNNHVWMSPNYDKARYWMNWIGPQSHIYEVHPGDKPQPWNLNGEEGWVAPHATVSREVTPSRAERRHPNDFSRPPKRTVGQCTS